MNLTVAFPGSNIPGGEAAQSLPSLATSSLKQGNTDTGFMRLVEEASRTGTNSKLSFSNSEPLLLKGSQADKGFQRGTSWESPGDAKDKSAFDWSRNSLQSGNYGSERLLSKPRWGKDNFMPSIGSGNQTEDRWKASNIIPSFRADAVKGHDPFSELVVEISSSRDSSPQVKSSPPVKWPSVLSVHGRPHTSRWRARRSSLSKDEKKFPKIRGTDDRVPPLPEAHAIRKPSAITSDAKLDDNAQRFPDPRTPRKSRRPRREGDLVSPLLSRSPRNSISSTPSPPKEHSDSDDEENKSIFSDFEVEELEKNASVRVKDNKENFRSSKRNIRKTTLGPNASSKGNRKELLDMGMGTLLSVYPQGREPTKKCDLVSEISVPEPLVAPLQAWSSAANSKNPSWHSLSDLQTDISWPPGKKLPPTQVSWTTMMEVGVQTEAVSEEDLDWDLSEHEDRETQTLPPNPTLFQLNRTDAFVQTDYRYLPLATSASSRPTTSLPVKKVDASTQTEHTTSSVSTQTEEPYLLPVPTPAPSRPHTRLQVIVHSDASAGPSTSGLGSALTRPRILDPLPGAVEARAPDIFPVSPPSSPELSPCMPLEAPRVLEGRVGTAEERWTRLAQLGVDDFLPSAIIAPAKYMRRKRMVDVSIQTDNDIITDEAPEFAARPPICKKSELLHAVDFTDLDVHVLTTPDEATTSLTGLVKYLCRPALDDLQRLRVIFRWVTEQIRFDWRFMDKTQTAEDILISRAGVGKDYVTLLVEMCHLAGIRVKKIHGFARGHDFRIGRQFDPDRDPLHCWTAVFLYGSWRLLDPTWGAGYTDTQGRYHPHLQDHFFLTDPDHFVFTHLPYDKHEQDYDRWQLLDLPLTLEEFNRLPKAMPEFFAYGLRMVRPRYSPMLFRHQTEVTLAASALIRYKYKFFFAEESEDSCINQWVFCTMKEGGAVVSFTVVAPETSEYVLKVYAAPESILEDEDSALDHVITYVLKCEKARRNPVPWPLHDVPWGPTPRLYECGLDPINQTGPIIVTWGGKKMLIFDKVCDILIMFQVFDSSGQLIDLKSVLRSEETEDHLKVNLIAPGIGFFKFLMYGIIRPQVRGRWRLPLLASYLIECKMSLHSNIESNNNDKKKTRRKIRLAVRR